MKTLKVLLGKCGLELSEVAYVYRSNTSMQRAGRRKY